MDPYEYFLHEKLSFYWSEIPNEERYADEEFVLKRNGYTLISVTGHCKTYKFAYQRLRLLIQKDLILIPLLCDMAFYKKAFNFCQLLRQFPDELESIEHVDLLLTLHGINKGA